MTSPLRLFAVLVGTAAIAAGALIALNASDTGSRPAPASTPDAGSTPDFVEGEPATDAVYVANGKLFRMNLDSETGKLTGRTLMSDVHASQSSPWIAYIVSRNPPSEEEPDFIPEPVLRLFNPQTTEDVEVGSGFSPLWHPTVAKFAFLRPIVERHCSGESCEGLFEVVTFDTRSRQENVLTSPGRFNLLAWSGERVLVADEADLSATTSIGPDGEIERLEIEPSELWDASPDGRYIVRSSPGDARLIDLESGAETALDVGEGLLATGAWSPDSRRIAAAVLNRPRTRARAVVIAAEDGSVEGFTDHLPGVLNVVWGPDSREFGFLTFVGSSNRLEINLCSSTDGRSSCETLGPPLQRATLLRFE